MTSVMLSPSARLKTRDAVNKIRHGSPKLKEVLRERCRQRMRDQRDKFVSSFRRGLGTEPDNVQNTLTEILRCEYKNLTITGEIFDLMENAPVIDIDEELITEDELFSEEERWLLQEYERMMTEEELLYSNADMEDPTCPLCMKSTITKKSVFKDFITCKKCDFRLSTPYTLRELGNLLQKCTEAHSLTCNGITNFTLSMEEDKACLYLICNKCLDITLVA